MLTLEQYDVLKGEERINLAIYHEYGKIVGFSLDGVHFGAKQVPALIEVGKIINESDPIQL